MNNKLVFIIVLIFLFIIFSNAIGIESKDPPPERSEKGEVIAEGVVVGEVVGKIYNGIKVKSISGKVEEYIPQWISGGYRGSGMLDRKVLDVISKLEVGDKVIIEWLVDNHVRIRSIRKIGEEIFKKMIETASLSKFEMDKKNKEQEIINLYIRGLGYYNNGEYEEALKIFQTVLVLAPNHENAKKDLEKTKKKISQKESLKHLKNGEDYVAKGKILEAIAEWNLAISSNPDDEEIKEAVDKLKKKIILERNEKAFSLFKENKTVDAIAEWNNVLALDPEDITAKKGLELANLKLKNLKEEEKRNLQYESIVNKANQLYNEKDYITALEFYNKAMVLKPTDEKIKTRINELKSLIEKSIKTSLDMANRYYTENKLVEAVKEWRNCLKLDPKNIEANACLKKYESEIKELRDKLYLEGLEAYGKEDTVTAVSKWEDVLILDPDYEKAQLNIEKAKRKSQK